MSIVQHKIENQQEMTAASASIGNGKMGCPVVAPLDGEIETMAVAYGHHCFLPIGSCIVSKLHCNWNTCSSHIGNPDKWVKAHPTVLICNRRFVKHSVLDRITLHLSFVYFTND